MAAPDRLSSATLGKLEMNDGISRLGHFRSDFTQVNEFEHGLKKTQLH